MTLRHTVTRLPSFQNQLFLFHFLCGTPSPFCVAGIFLKAGDECGAAEAPELLWHQLFLGGSELPSHVAGTLAALRYCPCIPVEHTMKSEHDSATALNVHWNYSWIHESCHCFVTKWDEVKTEVTDHEDQWLGVTQDQFPCEPTGTSSDNCQETDTHMVQARNVPRQPLPSHPSGHLGRQMMLWLAEEMPEGQHQKVGIPTHTRTA